VAVDNLSIIRGLNLTLELETTISAPATNSPDVAQADFALVGYPNLATHTSVSKDAILARLGDNGNCATATTSPCVIRWRVVLPELTLAQTPGGTMGAYNQQYIGTYSFTWLTSTGDDLAANFIINAVAANATDLGELAVPTAIYFFRTSPAMLNTASTGLSVPTFSSGEKVWVRHSFLVDSADVSAYRFTLQRAWVCWSSVPGFAPTVNPGTGCSQDIPGVMQASLGQRVLLFNISGSGGIADVTAPAGSTQKSKLWGWTQVLPTSGTWGGPTTNNGFSINALPLVFDASIHNYFFHLESEVTQTPLSKKRMVVRTIIGKRVFQDGAQGKAMGEFAVVGDQSVSASASLTAAWLSLFQ
jgi:hypothetical protein